ncbi:MAG: ABC transporter ATP-binding protein [Desulfobacteraceae bacterium]|nr:ABC transporter ATP-binding protein [Desulfobacteraceae bacterium]
MTGEAPLLAFDAVSFTYPGRTAPVLEDLSFEVVAGRFVSVEGPSGSGKSTLLRLACRLEAPDAGVVRFAGQPVDAMPRGLLRRRVSYVQQTPALLADSVRANLRLAFGLRVNRYLEAPGDGRLRQGLDEFLLEKISLDQPARELSVGQKQRLCLLRAMLLAPEVLLLDEPTAALDRDNARRVLEIVKGLNRHQGVTIVMVSHNPADARNATARVRLGGDR